jgi:hypothetical protein
MTYARAMMAGMTSQAETWGPNLHAYLEKWWQRLGTNSNAWSYANGIQGPTVSRWKSGTVPSLQAMLTVANALGVSMFDVLVAAGVVDKRELGREVVEPGPCTVDAALKTDPSLTELQRRTLTEMLAAIREVESGETGEVRGRAQSRQRQRRGR